MATTPEQFNVPAQLVKELRERTGAGFNDCRNALAEASGDVERAIDILRRKGLAAAQKKVQREASEGLIGLYIHSGGRIWAVVWANCHAVVGAPRESIRTPPTV